MKRQNSQRPRSKLTWHQNSSVASRGVFGLHSVRGKTRWKQNE